MTPKIAGWFREGGWGNGQQRQRGMDKAEAIRTLKKLWNCDRVVSFGDAVNDLPMFEVSDECYAVANAVPELKEAATGVIGDHEHDGVARWLLGHATRPAR